MKREIVISKSFIRKGKDDNIKVISNIKSDKQDYELWFKINKKYEKYILTEREDAFLVAVLPYAIKKELNIRVEGKVSERLYYQLTTYLIPLLCENFNKRIIKIDSELDNNSYNIKNAVGTGMSCGVDSFYTIANHTNRKEKNFNITHLTFFNSGSHGSYGGEKARKLYNERMKKPKEFAKENNFDFVTIDSNINEFLMMRHQRTHTFRSMACILIFQKLFSTYYYSSAFPVDKTKIEESDPAYYDLLNVQCLSTEDLKIYSAGCETNRIGKVKAVSKYDKSYKYLNVCVFEDKNCGICDKCRRTMLELYSIDKLKLYKDVFDIEYFNKNKQEYFVWLLKKKRNNDKFCIDIFNELKIRNKKIPIKAKIISLIPNKQDIKRIVFKFISEEKIRTLLKKEKKINDKWID